MGERDSPDPAFRTVFENRVRFAETDLQGIVFYGEYFTFQDEAVSAFLRDIEYGYDQMDEDGWQIHVVNAELNYRDGARFGDVIANDVRVTEIGTSSLTFEYQARRIGRDERRGDADRAPAGDAEREEETVLADGAVTHVGVDLETEEPIRIPDAFRDAVAAFQGGL